MASFDAKLLFFVHFICSSLSAPQQPEINDQFTSSTAAADDMKLVADEVQSKDDNKTNFTTNTAVDNHTNQENAKSDERRKHVIHHTDMPITTDVETKANILEIIYGILTRPISTFLSSPKVCFVIRNVGTCVVNGVMEIISHYFPAPLIPLIASAAGMVIPFEPVVMLKEKMPVTSYRRAFRKAMNSFLNTFDAYKLDSFDDDPYMTRRFNRRFMNDISGENKNKKLE